MAENSISRVFNGVHYEFEGIMGCKSGIKIANIIYKNKFLKDGQSPRKTLRPFSVRMEVKHVLKYVDTENYEAKMCDEPPPYPYMPNYSYTDFMDRKGHIIDRKGIS